MFVKIGMLSGKSDERRGRCGNYISVFLKSRCVREWEWRHQHTHERRFDERMLLVHVESLQGRMCRGVVGEGLGGVAECACGGVGGSCLRCR